MTVYNAVNREQLLASLSKAKAGDEIVLAKADYGSVSIGSDYSGYVTIRSATPLAARFETLDIAGASYLSIDGVRVSNSTNGSAAASKLINIRDGSHHIKLHNSEINGLVDNNFSGWVGVFVDGKSSYIDIQDNNIHDLHRGFINFGGAKNLTVSNNKFGRLGDDSMKFSGVTGAVIENNFSTGPAVNGTHKDFIQIESATTSENLVIRGNVLLPDTIGNVQGIFIGADYVKNVLIEDNILYTGMVNGIRIGAGTGITVQDNSLINMTTGPHSGTLVKAPSGSVVKNNIESSYPGDAGLKNGGLVMQNDDPSKPYYFGKYYGNPGAGLGATLEDFAIVKGSLAETLGAHDRIMALLGGGGSTPAPAPPSAPATAPEVIYSKLGNTEISGTSSVVNLAHASKYAVSAATIAFSFDADTVSGTRGLLTKDAYAYEGGGNHFATYIQNGVLNVMFEGASARKTFTVSGIKANQEYDLQASFGGGKVSVWLDDKLVGSASFNTDWTSNKEYLQIGAHGGWSKTGAADFQYVFDGTISDVRIAKGAQSLAAMDTLLGSALTLDGALGSGGEVLSETALEKAMDAAIRYWSDQGATAKELRVLSKTDVLIEDLGDGMLGRTAEQVITIDDDAAGYGWHADGGSAVEKGTVDLLSALTHEYGHILGYDHDVLGKTLSVGERHLPLDEAMPLPSDLI